MQLINILSGTAGCFPVHCCLLHHDLSTIGYASLHVCIHIINDTYLFSCQGSLIVLIIKTKMVRI